MVRIRFFQRIWIAQLVMISIFSANAPLYAANAPEQVVLLHGIARDDASMEFIAGGLRELGYEVHNIHYPSTHFTFDELRTVLHWKLEKLPIDANRPLHFVGYSMGGLMIRHYLAWFRPENLGRVVMIGTPNHGSEMADFLRNDPIFRQVFGKAGGELGTHADAIIHSMPKEVDYPLGIIAGDRSVDPISSAIIPGVDDGKVSVESTRLSGMSDHITIHASHLFIISQQETVDLVHQFLRKGAFR